MVKIDGEYDMKVAINGGTPKSSILMGFSLNHPAIGGTPMTMDTPRIKGTFDLLEMGI